MNPKVTCLFVVAILFFHQINVNGQKPERIDSLKYELSKTHIDTLQVQVLLSISMDYQSFQTDSAMAYAEASLKKSTAINYIKGRADALLHIGRLKRDQDKAAEA